MPFVSSPVAFPGTSSPHDPSPRKRRRVDSVEREPLQNISANIQKSVVAGFILDDSDDDTEGVALFKARDLGDNGQSFHHHVTGPQENKYATAAEEYRSGRYGHSETLASAPSEPRRSFEEAEDASKEHVSRDPQQPGMGMRSSGTCIRTCSGRVFHARQKAKRVNLSYEQMAAARSTTAGGRAQKSYYGVDVHQLMEAASREIENSKLVCDEAQVLPRAVSDKVTDVNDKPLKAPRTLMWTEKYRARKFTDLVGDQRTHRSVLKWLKGWDPTVFPNAARPRAKQQYKQEEQDSEFSHRKILLLTGPPGLGKTTLAHVCAKQAGYEVQEINASDERSRDVVKGRIRDMVGTENVKQVGASLTNKTKRAARPVCVVVDEVDGAVGGSSGEGEGGFIKALIDLLALDQKNVNSAASRNNNLDVRRKRKGEHFRFLRPLILICNDVYHPSLRLLRQGSMAEIVFIRKPPLSMVIPRLQQIFEYEGLLCDGDGIRQLCEATWGVSNRKEDKGGDGTCEGDMRGILVIGEWVATKLRAEAATDTSGIRLTKKWVEQNILGELTHGGGSARSLGRGGAKEMVNRIFAHNAGFPSITSMSRNVNGSSTNNVAENAKRRVMDRLRDLIGSMGEDDRALTDCFAIYPSLPYQDDTLLTKPGLAYDWLHFHDRISSLVHSSQQWELAPYLSTPLLAFHDLFAPNSRQSYSSTVNPTLTSDDSKAATETNAFTGLRASYAASESTKANRAALQQLQTQLSIPLNRVFRSPEDLSAELLPYVLRMLSPEVKPVVVGGSEKGVASVRRGVEKEMVGRAVDAMIACGVKFERGRVDHGDQIKAGDAGGWFYRMEPALDALGIFETAGKGFEGAKTRFAIRQVLEQEWKREISRREQQARLRRMKSVPGGDEELQAASPASKPETNAVANVDDAAKAAKISNAGLVRDFFGRPIACAETAAHESGSSSETRPKGQKALPREEQQPRNAWVTYHEGFSNAVRKGITLKELLEGF